MGTGEGGRGEGGWGAGLPTHCDLVQPSPTRVPQRRGRVAIERKGAVGADAHLGISPTKYKTRTAHREAIILRGTGYDKPTHAASK